MYDNSALCNNYDNSAIFIFLLLELSKISQYDNTAIYDNSALYAKPALYDNNTLCDNNDNFALPTLFFQSCFVKLLLRLSQLSHTAICDNNALYNNIAKYREYTLYDNSVLYDNNDNNTLFGAYGNNVLCSNIGNPTLYDNNTQYYKCDN